MARSFKESKRAHAKAKTLSNEDQEHKTRMEQLDAEASAWVYASKSRYFSHKLPPRRSYVFVTLDLRLENNEVSL